MKKSYSQYLLFKEDKASAFSQEFYDTRDRNTKAAKAIRMVDILNKQLKSGKISQKEFDERYQKTKDKYNLWALPKKGTESLYNDGPRPNKEKSPLSPNDFNHQYDKNAKRHDHLDKTTYEKIERHLDICNTTDDYKEYQVHRKQLCKILGLPLDSSLAQIKLQRNSTKNGEDPDDYGRIFIKGFSKSDDHKVSTDDSKFYHTSKADNLDYLTPQFRSKDGVLYSDKRSYFYKDKPGKRVGGSGVSHNEHAYQLNHKGKTAHSDPELRGSDAYYISSDDKIKVKKESTSFSDLDNILTVINEYLTEAESIHHN